MTLHPCLQREESVLQTLGLRVLHQVRQSSIGSVVINAMLPSQSTTKTKTKAKPCVCEQVGSVRGRPRRGPLYRPRLSKGDAVKKTRVMDKGAFLVTIWTTMKPQCVVNPAKNQPLTSHQFFKREESSICRLHPAAQLAGVRREGRSCLAFDTVARPLVLSPVLGFVGGSRLFWRTLRRVESLRERTQWYE